MMRKSLAPVLLAVLLAVVLVPTGAWARRITAGGSVTLSSDTGPLIDQVVITAIMSNPGLEKTVVTQLPLPGPIYVIPFLVNQETNGPQQGDIDTILLMSSTRGAATRIFITLRANNGSIIAIVEPPALSAFETRVIRLSELLP